MTQKIKSRGGEYCQETLFSFADFVWFPLTQKQFSNSLGGVGNPNLYRFYKSEIRIQNSKAEATRTQ